MGNSLNSAYLIPNVTFSLENQPYPTPPHPTKTQLSQISFSSQWHIIISLLVTYLENVILLFGSGARETD